MNVETKLPAVFAGKRFCKVRTLTPKEVRKQNECWKMLGYGVAILPGALLLMILFFPLGAICSILGVWMLFAWLAKLKESYAGKHKTAICPNCERWTNFWTTSAFKCPSCGRKLMLHGGSLYAIG